ncbi:MAG TPA: hypothetical protein DCQ08_00325 [Amoebophilaceae bacterium]|nr:hypothetical protein [Amoebophilaceae bacterium]
MKKLSTVLLICIGLIGSVSVVEAAAKKDFYELLEAIYSQGEEDVVYEVLQERLWEYYNDPLALNRASRKDLKLLCILTDDQLDQLFKHLTKNGPLISIYELQAIPGLDLAAIQLLVPFVSVEAVSVDYRNRSLWHKGLKARNSYGLMRYERTLENKRGYQRNNNKKNKATYAGSPNKILTRLSIKHSGWELGLSAREGAGEALTWDPSTQRYGFTSWRFYCLIKDKKRIKKWVVGDYAVGYGQGVVLNAGFSMGKSSETIKVIRTNNLGIRPHTSVATTAFRGMAATWQWHSIALTTYYSNVDLDGKVENNTSLGSQYVRSVSRNSYYRTQSEIAKKGQVNEQVLGSTLVYKGPTRGAELGINVLYSHYSLPIYPDTKRGNPLRFRGQRHANGSLFYRYLWQNFHFFGEGALSRGGGKAAVIGVVASLSHHADATVLWRHYGQNFHSPYGKSFRENSSGNSNEHGIYLGARIKPWHHLYLDTYYDYFYFPWCFGKPRAGHSWLAKATYQLTKTSLVSLQHKTSTKPHRVTKAKKTTVHTRQNYKLCWQYALSKAIRLKSEVQCSRYQQLGAPTWGYAAEQDATYNMRKLQLKGRVAWFNARHTHNKLYSYEPNVLHTGFNFRPCQGRGMRYCLLVCYQPTAAFRLELRYALTRYKDKHEIGSGWEIIKGNTKNDVTLQAIFKF